MLSIMRKSFLLLLAAILPAASLFAKEYSVSSPSGKLSMTVSPGTETTWSLTVNGQKVLDGNRIAMEIWEVDRQNTLMLGNNAKVLKARKGTVRESIQAPFYRQSSFEAEYNWLTLRMKGNYSLEFRAYDDGVAYRIVTENTTHNRIPLWYVKSEMVEFNFTDAFGTLVPYSKAGNNDRYRTSFENLYEESKAGDVASAGGRLAFMPVYVDLQDKGRLLLMESDLWDYPGMFLRTTDKGFEAEFPPYPEIIAEQNGKYLDYLNQVSDSRSYPWRVVAYADADAGLAVNNMVYQLATPSKLDDISWIEGGLSSWDWWNAFRLWNVPFKSGINTETYLYHIDFAARYGLKYVVIDEGWYKKGDMFSPIETMDIPRLCSYAKEKGVKVILWVSKGVLGLEPEKAFKHYSGMGVSGFKIDFFDSQEAAMVSRINMYAEKAAKYHLVVDFHGIFKPVGLDRTWPNVLNFEGVFGLENMKWCNPELCDMPRNDVILPFIRQAAGRMDYTPGAMRNAARKDFRAVNTKPMSQGTRAHQVACYVVFDEPLAMLCDSPSIYIQEDETTRFIASVPTVFDRTSILSGKIGEYIVTLREKDGRYYVGGLTSWQARDLSVDFSFLPEGRWKCSLFADGPNADTVGEDYSLSAVSVDSSSSVDVHLAPGGGFAMVITKD